MFFKGDLPNHERVQPNPFANYALSWLLVVVVALGLSSPLMGAEEPVTAADLVGSVMKTFGH